MAKVAQFFCAFLMIAMLFEYPVRGRPSVSKSDEDAGTADEQSPDFRHRWGSQHYQRPGQHHRPSTWPSSNRPAGWNTNTQYPIRRPVHGTTTQNMMVCPPTNLNNNWNHHQGMNQHYLNNNLNNAGHHGDPLNVVFLAFRDQEQDGVIANGAAIDGLGGSHGATFLGGNAEVGDNIQFN